MGRRRSECLMGKITEAHNANSFSSCTQCLGCPLNCWHKLNSQVLPRIPFPQKGFPQLPYLKLAFFKLPLLKNSVYFLKNAHLLLPCCFTSVQKPCPGKNANSRACLVYLCVPGTQNHVWPIADDLLNKWTSEYPGSHGSWVAKLGFLPRSVSLQSPCFSNCMLTPVYWKGQTEKKKKATRTGHTKFSYSLKEIHVYNLKASDMADSNWKG